MPPEQGAGSELQTGFSRGSADDLYRMRDEIEVHGAALLVVSSADHVHHIDVGGVLRAHRESGAEATVVTAEVTRAEAVHNVAVDVGADGRVLSARDKPEHPVNGTVATELFVLNREVVLAELEQLRRARHDRAGYVADGPSRSARSAETGGSDLADTHLGDLADSLLPALSERGTVLAVPVTGYWKDVGRPEAYLQAHRDLLRGQVDVFAVPGRPVLTAPDGGLPAAIRDGAVVRDSLLGHGATVRGQVERSVIGPGVVIQAGARVVDSVLFEGVLVEAGAAVHTAVLDEGVRIGRGATVGARPRATRLRGGDVTLLGKDAVVRRGTAVQAGGRMEPGSRT